MMWIDIGVTVLLTLRIVLFRLALPQFLDPTNDARLPEGRDEQQEYLFTDDGEGNEHSPRKSSSGNSGISQLHIHVMPDLNVRW
jgi:hypothetical protein